MTIESTWPLLWSLEWAKVKCKYDNRKHMHDFLYDGNGAICHICCMNEIIAINMRDLDLSFEWAMVKRKYANRKPFYMMTIVMFSLLVTSDKVFTMKMCMAWPWPLKYAKLKSKCASRKPRYDFLFDDNSNICSISQHLRYSQIK